MKLKLNKKMLLIFLVSITIVGFGMFLFVHSSNTWLRPMPKNWKQTSKKSSISNFCLGGGSECGSINAEYQTNNDMNSATSLLINNYKKAGWEMSEPELINNELQFTAKNQKDLIYFNVTDNLVNMQRVGP